MYKEINSLPQTLIFSPKYLDNQILDISNYEFCYKK